MALTGIVLSLLGLVIGVAFWITVALSPDAAPIPGREVTEADRAVLVSMQVVKEAETIELFYASGMFSIREGGAVITQDRLVLYSGESDVQASALADIRAIDFTAAANWFEEGQFLIERDDGEFMVFTVSGVDSGDQLFHRVLERQVNEAREAAGKEPVVSGRSDENDDD